MTSSRRSIFSIYPTTFKMSTIIDDRQKRLGSFFFWALSYCSLFVPFYKSPQIGYQENRISDGDCPTVE